jgi:acyl carrier protein
MEYINKVKKTIAEKAGVDVSEVKNESFIEDDLNLGGLELVDILETLEEALHVELLADKDNFETVGDLIEAIAEQVE